MSEVKACGVIVFRREPTPSFLLMRHPSRWDLPKGHVDRGESDVDCALRELKEETGIEVGDIELDSNFRFVTRYPVRDRQFPGEVTDKTLLIFLGWLKRNVPIRVSEHEDFKWFDWNPPHQIQPFTIDPLLSELEQYFRRTAALGESGEQSAESRESESRESESREPESREPESREQRAESRERRA